MKQKAIDLLIRLKMDGVTEYEKNRICKQLEAWGIDYESKEEEPKLEQVVEPIEPEPDLDLEEKIIPPTSSKRKGKNKKLKGGRPHDIKRIES